MEDNASDRPVPKPDVQLTGGKVEPLNRAMVAKERFQTPEGPLGVGYELRDPFAEVTYRSDRFDEIAAKADQLGSVRFTAVALDGVRTPVIKSGNRWELTSAGIAEIKAPKLATEQTRSAAQQPSGKAPGTATPTHQIDANAEHSSLIARLETALTERYVIKRSQLSAGDLSLGQTEYRFKGDTSRIAFIETTFRLATDTNSPSIARSMVDVAEARNWQALRVSGNEEFRRMVWLEASARGVKTVGYEPVPADLQLLKKLSEARQINRVEPADPIASNESSPTKGSGRGGGRKAVLAAIDAILVARGVAPARREAVMRAASEQLAERVRKGQSVAVKVYDASAPTQQRNAARPAEKVRSQDRASPTR